MPDSFDCDVAVLGAGLAGLTAAITVASAGHRVMVFERLSRAGGLCGTFVLDGHEFVRACNEFGSGVERMLKALSVEVTFRPSHARVFIDDRQIEMPPRISDIATFMGHAAGFLSFVRGWQEKDTAYLGDLLERHVRDTWVHDLFGFVASTSAIPLEHIRRSDMTALVRERHGWHRPVKPIGGPAEIVKALVRRAEDLGVAFQFDAPASARRWDSGGFVVETPRGPVRCREVISSAPRWDAYPAVSWPASSHGVVLIAPDREVPFPGRCSTVHYIPRGVQGWMKEQRAGRLPNDFGFLLTRRSHPTPPTARTLVGFFSAPLGRDEFSDADRRHIEGHVRAKAERMIPGIASAIRYLRILSPGDFQRIHGLSSAPFARLPPAGFEKPPSLDARTGVHHAGVSVGPPGAETGATMACGRLAGDEVARLLASTRPARAAG